MKKAIQVCTLVYMGLGLLGAAFYAGYLVGKAAGIFDLMGMFDSRFGG